MNNQIWIAWEKHRRSIELGKWFDCRLIILDSALPRLLKFPLFFLKTLLILVKSRPKLVFAQNPSIFLNTFLLCLRPVFRYQLISDIHNGAIIPDHKILQKGIGYLPYQIIHRKADYCIVTNERLAEIVKDNGGRYLILPDTLPSINKKYPKIKLKGSFQVCCICTFGMDEPIKAIFDAAHELELEDVFFYISGSNSNLKKFNIKRIPRNIILTGFLPDEAYFTLLSSVNIVMDLTTRDDCLVCGAYEAIALRKPLILTNTKVLRETFYKGVIFTENDSKSISNAIKTAKSQEESLKREISSFRIEFKEMWLKKFNSIKKELNKRIIM